MRQKTHDIIATYNSIGHADVFIGLRFNAHSCLAQGLTTDLNYAIVFSV